MASDRAAPERQRGLVVAHDIPGRLRLRLPPAARTENLQEALARLPGVLDCAWSARTRSLLVRYHPGAIRPAAIVDAVRAHAGVAAEASLASLGAAVASPRAGLAEAVRETFAELNGSVVRVTGGGLDLGTLVPLLLAVWAGVEIVRGRVVPLAWSTALWYAHGLFRDYNVDSRS
jgi:hypothetical protein